MSDIAIRAEGLTKLYHIGGKREKYRTLRDSLVNAMSAPMRRLRYRSNGASGDTIFALKDVSFQVKQGEVVGIIGRNGAGKSTLLKILSSITEPSAGYVDIYGRVGSLLEVGTGFHPELTGSENIYLNGAILGMRRVEITRKFDEIVAFAEIEPFIDTPVKHYSSGMYMRLAFAVAAHLEPEILIVDEVLAVGDSVFQKKCLGKMSTVANEGRTVLFVSHNMAAVDQLCPKAILLRSGELAAYGPVEEIIDLYLGNSIDSIHASNLLDRKDRKGNGAVRFSSVEVLNDQDQVVDHIAAGSPVQFRVSLTSFESSSPKNLSVAIRIDDILDRQLFTFATKFTGNDFHLTDDSITLVCQVPVIPLLSGEYKIHLWASVNGAVADSISDCGRFAVEEANVYSTGIFPNSNRHGIIFLPHSWSMAEAIMGQ